MSLKRRHENAKAAVKHFSYLISVLFQLCGHYKSDASRVSHDTAGAVFCILAVPVLRLSIKHSGFSLLYCFVIPKNSKKICLTAFPPLLFHNFAYTVFLEYQ